MKIIKILVFIVVLILIFAISNQILLSFEANKIIPYGRKISVLGKNINIVEMGKDHKEKIVFLPGYGTIAPGLDFYPLMEELAKNFHVVAIEPFGYGDSDQTTGERSIENICQEIHLTLEGLGIDRYILCAHSISGIYSLYYLQQFPEEVTGFIGLDTSVPNQMSYQTNIFYAKARRLAKNLGFIRLANLVYPQAFRATNSDYEIMESQIKYRVNRDFANETNINEGVNFERNWQAVKGLSYPAKIKTIFILSDQGSKESNWRYRETKKLINNADSHIYLMDGGHYIHRTNIQRISKLIAKEFL